MTNAPLLVVSLLVLAVVLLAASGWGSQRRVLGLHVPYVDSSPEAWIAGHRAARKVVVPTSAIAALLSIAGLVSNNLGSDGFGIDGLGGPDSLAGIGWAIWILGLVSGTFTASSAARVVMQKRELAERQS